MNKISKFIFKNVDKISLFISLILGNSDSTIVIVIVILLLIYLKKSNYDITKNITKIIKDFKENKNDNEIKNNKSNDDDFDLDSKSNNVDDIKNKKDEKHNNTEDLNIKKDNEDNKKDLNIKKDNEDNKKDLNIKKDNEDNKKDLKLNYKKTNAKDKNDYDTPITNPYPNKSKNIKLNYSESPNNYDFLLNVNNTTCSTPMFTMRTYKDIDFYFNFILHDYDTKKIHDLIMCKDIHHWMSTSSLSEEDISNEFVPVYFCLKNENNNIKVCEYLKVFINSNGDEKIAFVQKGNDYIIIEEYIELLIEKDIIQDLLSGKLYTSYNLSINEGVSTFLNKFLSLVLISESFIGEQVKLDIENYYENKSIYQYLLNTLNEDTSVFNTTI